MHRSSSRPIAITHDGQVDEDISFVPAYYLLDAAMIVEIWEDMQTYAESFEWKPEWIPFARFDCDYLCLDARTGRVLEFFLKFPDRPVIANSFGEPDPDEELAWTAIWERECAAPT